MGNGIRWLQPIFLQPIFGDSMQEALISFFIKQGIIADFKSMVLRRLIPNILDSLKKCQNLICVLHELLIPFVVLCELYCYYSQFAGEKSNHRWFEHIGSMWEHQDLNSQSHFLQMFFGIVRIAFSNEHCWRAQRKFKEESRDQMLITILQMKDMSDQQQQCQTFSII